MKDLTFMMKGLIICVVICWIGSAKSKPAFLEEVHPVVCEYKGLTFSPGEGRYVDHEGCKVTIVRCKFDGSVQLEDKYDCSFTSTHASHPTATSSTTTHETLGPVCHYRGTYYKPGEVIHEGSQNGLCYGSYCSNDLKIIEFSDVECNFTSKAKPKTIAPPPDDDDQLFPGCVVDGMLFEPGEVISRYQHKEMCVEKFCGEAEVQRREFEGDCE